MNRLLEEAPLVSTPPPGRRDLRVLVIDDDPDSGRIIRHVLATRAGMDVTVLLDPADALTMAEDHSWDVVVTDVVMPGMSGLELMRRLRQRWPSLPVVTITGRVGVEVATYLILSEADGMLSKPVDPVALLEVVRRLGGRRQG